MAKQLTNNPQKMHCDKKTFDTSTIDIFNSHDERFVRERSYEPRLNVLQGLHHTPILMEQHMLKLSITLEGTTKMVR
jgi:hypothetical protein